MNYEHDCETCIPLGTAMSGSRSVDLYYHPADDVLRTVIARWGSKGWEYLSGLALVGKHPALTEAAERAVALGFAPPSILARKETPE